MTLNRRQPRKSYLASRIELGTVPLGTTADGQLALAPNLSLANGETHVWFVGLQQISRHLDSFLEVIAPNEAARAARFFFERDRNEYILARGLLRYIVGCYTGLAPHLLRFHYNSYGKPTLADESGGDQPAFNLSHSRGMVVYAVTKAPYIGVDLEYMHQNIEFDQIVARFFSSREASLFRQLPSERKQEAFFSGWTRKEAYMKASGEGLWLDPRSVEVTFAPGGPASLLSVAGVAREAQRWSLVDLPAPTGYAAAVVVEGAVSRIQCWQWPA